MGKKLKKTWVLLASLLFFLEAAARAETDVERVKASLQRIEKIHTQADFLLQQFDQHLDALLRSSPGSGSANFAPMAVFEQASYGQILAAWQLSDIEFNKIAEIYERGLMSEQKLKVTAATPQLMESQEALFYLRESLKQNLGNPEHTEIRNLVIDLSDHFHNEMDWIERLQIEPVALQQENQFLSQLLSVEATGAIEQKFASSPYELRAIQNEIELAAPKNLQEIREISQNDLAVTEINGSQLKHGEWALTFDDGPSAAYTPHILDNLKAHGLKASFMWLAQAAPHLESIVERAESEGMTLGNHSFTHALLTKSSAAGLRHEILESNAVLKSAYRRPIRAYRCPYGACGKKDSSIHQMIRSQGLTSVMWNVDTLDWQDHNPQSIYLRAKKQMAYQGRGIILFHDIHPQSVIASELLMRDLASEQAKGIVFVRTLDQVLDSLENHPTH